MKLLKIRFTHWRDQGAAPRAPAVQRQLDYLVTRVGVLSREAADLETWRSHADNAGLRQSIAKINANLRDLEGQRTLLLYEEWAEREAAHDAARKHPKVGTFGYQILDNSGTRVIRVMDEGGNDLPENAVYAYELVEIDPPMPSGAMAGALESRAEIGAGRLRRRT